MSTLTTKDGTQIYYKDWGKGQPVVPIGASALLATKIVTGSTLKVYAGGSHGVCSTQKDQLNADLLAFFEAKR